MDDIRRLALSCLLLGWVGPTPPDWVSDALGEGLGGVVLFASNLGDGTGVDRLTSRLRAAAGRDVVLALDEEGGDVTRLDAVRGSRSPGAAALGYLDDVATTAAVHRLIGARCAAAGVTLDLAPVADVNVDPRNPVIGLRAFSADPVVAARHVAAAVAGVQESGVAACLKHFPGHGATSSDTHHEATTLARSRDDLDAVELLPFRAGIAAGARAVMTSHLLVPALDADHLATVSSVINTDVLRLELGFTGTVVTDALEMRALADSVGVVEGFVQALIAGADAIETGARDYPHLVREIPDAVARAVDTGRLDTARLRDAAARTAQLAAAPVAVEAADVPIGTSCIEVIGTLPALDRPLVVECRAPSGMASGTLPWSLGSRLVGAVPGAELVQTESPVDLPAGRQVVAVVRDPQRHAWQAALAAAADVVVDCGWPTDLEHRGVLVRTRGVSPVLLDAAATVLIEGAR